MVDSRFWRLSDAARLFLGILFVPFPLPLLPPFLVPPSLLVPYLLVLPYLLPSYLLVPPCLLVPSFFPFLLPFLVPLCLLAPPYFLVSQRLPVPSHLVAGDVLDSEIDHLVLPQTVAA